jgi:hypothetical protein
MTAGEHLLRDGLQLLLLPGAYDHLNSLERRQIELRIVKAPRHIFADRRARDLTATLDRISALGQ